MDNTRGEPYRAARELLDQKKYVEAFALYEKLARDGDPQCQITVGWMCHEGRGTAKDRGRAVDWFRQAATLGSKEGAFYCGKSALGLQQYDEALGWFQKAAAKEYGPALLWLGLAYVRGLGVEADFKKGIKYLERASATGNFPAQRELALLMIRGNMGMPRVLVGVALFVSAVVAAIISSMTSGHTDKLMG
jgi:uncharacterized protein